MKREVCGRVEGTNRAPLGCFNLFIDGGGRSPLESEGVRGRIGLEKAAVRRETRNI